MRQWQRISKVGENWPYFAFWTVLAIGAGVCMRGVYDRLDLIITLLDLIRERVE